MSRPTDQATHAKQAAHDRGKRGFTLLEVLAAVAILGLWYVVLAGLAVQGLRAEGESARHLQASFLADEIIADFQVQLSAGSAPPLSNDESERGDFQVRIDIEPFVLPGWLEGADEPQATDLRAGRGAARPTLLSSSPNTLRTIRVEVGWLDGFEERSVVRSTYAFDLEAARPLLEPLDPSEDGPTPDQEPR